MLNKQTVQTIGIQAENMNKQRKLDLSKKDEWQNGESRSFDWFGRCHRNAEASRFFLSPANS